MITSLWVTVFVAVVLACGESQPPSGSNAEIAPTSSPTEQTVLTVTPVTNTVIPTVKSGNGSIAGSPQEPGEPPTSMIESSSGQPPRTVWHLLEQYASYEHVSLFIIGVTVGVDEATVVYSVENSQGFITARLGSLAISSGDSDVIEITALPVFRVMPGMTIGAISFPTNSILSNSTFNLTVDSFWVETVTGDQEIFGAWDLEFLEADEPWNETGNMKLIRAISADAKPVASINLAHGSILSFDLNTGDQDFPERIYLRLLNEGSVRQISYEEFVDVATGRAGPS